VRLLSRIAYGCGVEPPLVYAPRRRNEPLPPPLPRRPRHLRLRVVTGTEAIPLNALRRVGEKPTRRLRLRPALGNAPDRLVLADAVIKLHANSDGLAIRDPVAAARRDMIEQRHE